MPTPRDVVTILGLTCLLSACEPAGDPGPGGDSPPGAAPEADALAFMPDEDIVEKSTVISKVTFQIGDVMHIEQELRVFMGHVPFEELDYEHADEAMVVHSERRLELVDGIDATDWTVRVDMDVAQIHRKGHHIDQQYSSPFEGGSYEVHYEDERYTITNADGTPVPWDQGADIRRGVETSRIAYDVKRLTGQTLEPGEVIPFASERQVLLQALLSTEETLQGEATYRGLVTRNGKEVAVFDLFIDEVPELENMSAEMPLRGRAWLEVKSGRMQEMLLRGTQTARAYTRPDRDTRYFLYENHALWTFED